MPPTTPQPSVNRRVQRAESHDGLSVSAYRGDGAALLAFDLDQAQTKDFAGFAIFCAPPTGHGAYLPNRLNFDCRNRKAFDVRNESSSTN